MAAAQDRVLRGPKYDLDLPQVTLGKYIFSGLLKHGDHVAQVYPGEPEVRLSFRELSRRAACVAEELRMRGVGPGDVVALGCRVVPQFAPLLIGTLLRNAIPAPFNPELDQEELKVVVQQTLKPKLVVSQEPALSAVGEAAGCPALPLSQVDGWLQRDADPERALQALSPPDAAGWLDSCAAILCSSGTTGPPKGVMLSHRGLLTLTVAFGKMFAQFSTSSDRRPEAMISTSPTFWASGLIMPLYALHLGKTACILPSFDEDTVARVLGEYNILSLFMPPNLAVTIAKNPYSPVRKMLHHIKILSVGGAVMDAETQLFVEKELGKRVSQGYGMTESIVIMGAQPGSDPPPGSSGKLFFNVEAKVVDLETQEPVGPGQEGELWVKSPVAALGYWNNPEATAAAWDEDGWFHTGDVVRYDRDGYFYVVDRVKQLIKFRGHHVLSPQLENLLMSHPSVQLAAVVGKPHPTDQEHPTAFVVLRPGASATAEELQRLVDDKVADHKKLRGGVRIVGELPHTASGKVAKRVLRRWAAGGQ
ncbi:luciferin 4-monooxygenase-like isoform X2 [Schistocerca gregaria]|uniref:luciferin 4-monooxygenase-like isoform X1 n=1 Tax=Schistocerca gregaria TaxID=7010 RepID=UPI00211EFE65|nr:luciferin 4-monooxygenase-like isoform X1 [Schistocerca gregaria]XP_049851774.1 luciferin 4-monooxygenase-like isoform X2 [Schistocerca gregaria]